jgi:hypothetical protein
MTAKKSKKKSTRKPKVNAVSRTRQPRRATTHRAGVRPENTEDPPAAGLPAGTSDGAEKEPGAAAEATSARWGAYDPDALWWDDVWPFKDTPASQAPGAPHGSDISKEPDDRPDLEPAPAAPVPVPRSATRAGGAVSAAPPRERSRRRGWFGVLAAVTVVLVGVAWFATARHTTSQPQLSHNDSFAPPGHLMPDTSFVRTRVLPSGDLEVTQWIRSRNWVYAVTLSTPRVAGLATGTLSTTGVALGSDGKQTATLGAQGFEPGTRIFELPPTHSLYIRYRLSGVLEKSPGASGRALARITSLDVRTRTHLVSTTRTVVGARVLNLACTPDKPNALTTPCGIEHGGVWSVRLPRGQEGSQVMAQLDLS